MAQLMRFGRRVPLPSTAQIIHDLRLMEENDKARKAASTQDAGKADRDVLPPAKNTGAPPQV
jgi:hypothetical protein